MDNERPVKALLLLKALRDVAELDHTPILREDTEKYIIKLLGKIKPKRILEVGTAIGYSAILFAAFSEAHVYSIEKDEYILDLARHNINLSGLNDRITLLCGDGQEQMEKLRDKDIEPFDLILIDAGKSHYRRFMEAATYLSKPGTVILSDDVSQRGLISLTDEKLPHKHRTAARKMKEYIEFLKTAPYLSTEFLDIGDGLAVSTYKQTT